MLAEFLIFIILLFLTVFLLLLFIYTIYSIFKGAPYIPTSKGNIKKMIELAEPHKEQNLIDLGSGDGRILFSFAPYVNSCTGVELNHFLVLYSKLKAKFFRQNNVNFLRQDLWKIDLSKYDLVTLYFVPIRMEQLEKKILQEMKPGAKIISNHYKFPNLPIVKESGSVYLYQLN